MKPPPSEPLTYEELVVDAISVPDFEELWDSPELFEELRESRRKEIRTIPEPVELARLALLLAPEQCRKGNNHRLKALWAARELFDEAVKVAISETDDDRQALRYKSQRKYVEEHFKRITDGDYLRFKPESPSTDDEYYSRLEEAGEMGGLMQGYWFKWGMDFSQPDPEEKGVRRVSKWLLDFEIARVQKARRSRRKLRDELKAQKAGPDASKFKTEPLKTVTGMVDKSAKSGSEPQKRRHRRRG